MSPNFREKYLRKIAPVYVACVLGLLAVIFGTVSILLSPYRAGLELGLLSVAALVLFTILLIERYLATKIAFKKLFLMETLLIAALPVIWSYEYQTYEITVKTERNCFVAVYSDSGIQLKDLPRSGLFDRNLIVYNSVVWVHKDLANEENFYLLEPREWGGYSSQRTDTLINGKAVEVVQYARNKDANCETELLTEVYSQLSKTN